MDGGGSRQESAQRTRAFANEIADRLQLAHLSVGQPRIPGGEFDEKRLDVGQFEIGGIEKLTPAQRKKQGISGGSEDGKGITYAYRPPVDAAKPARSSSSNSSPNPTVEMLTWASRRARK